MHYSKEPNNFDEEADRLEEITTKLNSGSDIEIQLKNYLLYRMISFFEFNKKVCGIAFTFNARFKSLFESK